jgi:hypothetical protein
MSNYYTEELIKQLDDAQWEAEYGDDRLRLLREEEDNASVGEVGHDGCFPKAQVWTVWANRVHKRGFLIHFHDLNEAYIYAMALLNSTKMPVETVSTRECLEVHNTIKSNKLLYIGKCESLQVAVFRGHAPTTELKVLCTNKLYQIRPSYALILGAEGEPEDQVENKKSSLIIKVPISKYDLQDWQCYV